MDNYKLESLVSETELRKWMNAEIDRLGDLYEGFTITWNDYNGDPEDCIPTQYCLEIWSISNYVLNPPLPISWPWGTGETIIKVFDDSGSCLPELLSEGRKLYYKLRKDYAIKRNLGAKKHG